MATMNVGKILVIDDNPEDGEAISKAVWQNGWPVLFVHFNPATIQSYGKYHGVRAVFLDIDLLGSGSPGSEANLFATAVSVLSKLLDDENGPYSLITWSTYDDKAERLYAHLQERLPLPIRPVSLDRMDKAIFHGEKDYYISKIKEAIERTVERHCAIRRLVQWEGVVQSCSSEVVANLANMARGASSDFDNVVQWLLWKMAKAKSGKWMQDDLDGQDFSLMSTLLSDRLGYIKPDAFCVDEDCFNAMDTGELTPLISQINSFLHIDFSPSGQSMPGAVFKYPVGSSELTIPRITDPGSCIRGHFLNFENGVGKQTKKEISCDCELMVMDIIPPCDHSQKKTQWRRFMAVCRIPLKHAELINAVDHKENKRMDRYAENLWKSPVFSSDGQEFVLAFNANLQGTIVEPSRNDWSKVLGERKFRIREQMLRDVIGWMGRHITRSGHVALAF